MKAVYAVMLWLVLCVPIVAYVIDSDEKHADYYRVGTLNWQNEGSYQNKHNALYVSIDQCQDGEKSTFKLNEIQPAYIMKLPRPDEHTYYSVVKTKEIDNFKAGDYVILRFSYNIGNGKHCVTDMFEMQIADVV
jgi:hypothetical protein